MADGAGGAGAPARSVRALAYPDLVGTPAVGDRVLLNVSALERGLGTGGMALVVALPDRLPADPPAGPGHVVKARYTPLQSMVLGVDEQESPHHAALRDADDLGGHARGRGRPALGRAGGGGGAAGPGPAGAGRLRDDRRRRAAAGLLAHGVDAGRRRVARLDRHGRAGVRRRPRGGQRAHRPARRGPRRAGRRRGGGPGPRQPRHRHPVGLLRHQRRRGGQRRRDPGRPGGGLAADLRGRCPGAAPGRVTPQPHRLRAGGPGTGGRARAAAARGVRRAGPRSRRRPWSTPAAAGCGCTRSRWTASTRRWPSAPSGSRRWAAGWTRTGPRSWPRRPPAGTRRPCSAPAVRRPGPAPPAPSGRAVRRPCGRTKEPVPAPEGLERALQAFGARTLSARRRGRPRRSGSRPA